MRELTSFIFNHEKNKFKEQMGILEEVAKSLPL